MANSDERGILAEGMAMSEEVKQTNLNKLIRQVVSIAIGWYKKEEYDSMLSKQRNISSGQILRHALDAACLYPCYTIGSYIREGRCRNGTIYRSDDNLNN